MTAIDTRNAEIELRRKLQLLKGQNGEYVLSTITDVYALIDFIKSEQSSLLDSLALELPKKERVGSNPNTEDRKLRAMWNRGSNNTLEEVQALLQKKKKELEG